LNRVAEVCIQAIPEYEYLGPDQRLLLVLVNLEELAPERGDVILARAQRHFPTLPPMLVALANNGFKAYAHFHTHKFLALVQMLQPSWIEVDLYSEPVDETELPF